MSLPTGVRFIVVDGHSMLMSVPSLAHQHRANPRKARALLVRWLQQFQDFSGARVSVVFDGTGDGSTDPAPDGAVEVRYARADQTADALIERAVAGWKRPGEIAVVTADLREQCTVESLGAHPMHPASLASEIVVTCPGAQKIF